MSHVKYSANKKDKRMLAKTPRVSPKTTPSRSTRSSGCSTERPRQRRVPCTSCGFCCTYVAYEINEPSTVKRATEILWHLYHPGVVIYCDGTDWYGQYMSRCRNLDDTDKCQIYRRRPHICREHDEKNCEINAEEKGWYFNNVNDFLEYLKQNRKRVYSAVEKEFSPSNKG
jgi:uncharacterized protein